MIVPVKNSAWEAAELSKDNFESLILTYFISINDKLSIPAKFFENIIVISKNMGTYKEFRIVNQPQAHLRCHHQLLPRLRRTSLVRGCSKDSCGQPRTSTITALHQRVMKNFSFPHPPFITSIISSKLSIPALKFSIISFASTSGSGRLSRSVRLSSLSQVMSRLVLSLSTISS